MDFTTNIKGHVLEYMDDIHTYLVDGVVVPSITQILHLKFKNKYEGVGADVLKRAADKGTEVHEAIERYCRYGEESELPEISNFKFLKKQYGFEVTQNEVPVILFFEDEPVAAGRLDMVLTMNGEIGGADIKRTSSLDKLYIAYQLNLYRIAYRQSYGIEWNFLRALHLREDVRRFVKIPINEGMAIEMVEKWRDDNE